MRHPLVPALGAGLLFLAACGGGQSSSASAGTGAGNSGTGGNAGTCPGDLAAAPDSEFCSGDPATIDCSMVTSAYHTQVCGVPVLDPTDELGRSSGLMEFSGSGPPELGCFAPGGYPTQGTPQTVTVKGVAKIFSHGCMSKDLTIEFHKVKRTGGTDEADIGDLVGSAFVTPDDCTTTSLATDNMDCGTRYECNYSYPGVPSETELLVLTKGDLWAPLYEYNIYVPNAEVQAGAWTHDVRALASDDYGVIAQVAIGSPITPGNGAIAGEVHDCGDVRLHGATVNLDVPSKVVTYFSSDELHPLPDLSATSTSTLGLYAAMDVSPTDDQGNPRPATVAALGLVGGKVTTVGFFRVRVFPDSVTAVTFSGVRPFQVPPAQ